MNITHSHRRFTARALGALAGLVLLSSACALAQPSSASAASANWYFSQLDNDGCWDAARWWDGARWLGYYWLDTNNDCTFGETYVSDADNNGSGDEFWMRRGNAGNWSTLIDVRTSTIYRGQNGAGDYLHEGPYGTWWSSMGFYQSTVGPPTNPSGAYNLALAFARQGYVY